MLSCLIPAALWSPSGKGLTLCSLVCCVFLCFVIFPYGVSDGSGKAHVFDCIDS